MTGEGLQTIYHRKGPNSPVVAIEMGARDADHVLATWPFAWSTSSRADSFAPWPWPAMAQRGKPCDPPSWSPSPGAA